MFSKDAGWGGDICIDTSELLGQRKHLTRPMLRDIAIEDPNVCEVSWLTVLQFLRFVRAKDGLETWRNTKKDSYENKKTIKDSKVIQNRLNIVSCINTHVGSVQTSSQACGQYIVPVYRMPVLFTSLSGIS